MRIPLQETFKRASIQKRLWLGAAAIAIFIGTLAAAMALTPPDPDDRGKVGLDFIAFYTAGRFVREGRSAELYDIHQVQVFQHELARRNGVDLGSAVGPWWNPPFYAWTFVPLAKLGYREAIKVWTLINLGCAAIATAVLCSFVAKFREWRSWALVPVLLVLSTPFIHAISHGQNTCTSLLVVTIAVAFWRRGWAIAAGMTTGLMFYKPQLGAALSAVLVLSQGRRALLGLSITGAGLLLASLALPGSIDHFLHRMPWNLHFVQCEVPYLWDRHVTFKAFWRLLIQGSAAGEPWLSVTLLAGICQAGVGIGLIWAVRRGTIAGRSSAAPRGNRAHDEMIRPPHRSSGQSDSGIRALGRLAGCCSVSALSGPARGDCFATDARHAHMKNTPAVPAFSRDRLIAATIAATPLLMPFYFDYDQLLLAIPAVLFAAERVRRDRAAPLPWTDRWLLRIWPAQYAWLLLNSDVASVTHLNLGVPLLTAVAGLLIARAGGAGKADSASISSHFTAAISPALHLADMDTDASIPADQPVALTTQRPSDPQAPVENRNRLWQRAGDRDHFRRPRESA
ncbi:MAG TPA: glycosyltransferase family 87 protein [Tepidisphaeraceae bacterium]|nr:glycosyltransferase family 87 protein [Tepidisphaeraceae bacterium]